MLFEIVNPSLYCHRIGSRIGSTYLMEKVSIHEIIYCTTALVFIFLSPTFNIIGGMAPMPPLDLLFVATQIVNHNTAWIFDSRTTFPSKIDWNSFYYNQRAFSHYLLTTAEYIVLSIGGSRISPEFRPKTYYLAHFFCQKLHKNESNWTNRGSRIPGTPLDLSMLSTRNICRSSSASRWVIDSCNSLI